MQPCGIRSNFRRFTKSHIIAVSDVVNVAREIQHIIFKFYIEKPANTFKFRYMILHDVIVFYTNMIIINVFFK